MIMTIIIYLFTYLFFIFLYLYCLWRIYKHVHKPTEQCLQSVIIILLSRQKVAQKYTYIIITNGITDGTYLPTGLPSQTLDCISHLSCSSVKFGFLFYLLFRFLVSGKLLID